MTDALPTPDVEVESITPTTLQSRIDGGEPVTILDVRVPSDYDEWALDGEAVETVNVPYYRFADVDGDDPVLDEVPEADPLVVVCGKGGASEYVAALLREERDRNAINLAEGMSGWARVYERERIPEYDGPGTVYQYQRPSSGCLAYLVVSDGKAAVLDPLRAFTDRYVDDTAALGADLTYAIDTHVHADHVSGVRALAGGPIEGVLPEGTADRGLTYADDVRLVADGEELIVGDVTIEVMHTPGHTSGMTSYLIGDSLLVSGDGLFTESVARPDLEAGDDGAPDAAEDLYETLQERILPLPDDTLIAGGHVSNAAEPTDDGTYVARLGDLVGTMDELRMDEEAFVETVLADMPPRPANYEDIIATNLGTRETDDEEAFELELGPNNCAASTEPATGNGDGGTP